VAAFKKISADAIKKQTSAKSETVFKILASLKFGEQRAVLFKYKLYIPGPQFNNVAIGSSSSWKGSARQACSKGGKLKPSIQISRVQRKRAFFSVNKANHSEGKSCAPSSLHFCLWCLRR